MKNSNQIYHSMYSSIYSFSVSLVIQKTRQKWILRLMSSRETEKKIRGQTYNAGIVPKFSLRGRSSCRTTSNTKSGSWGRLSLTSLTRTVTPTVDESWPLEEKMRRERKIEIHDQISTFLPPLALSFDGMCF